LNVSPGAALLKVKLGINIADSTRPVSLCTPAQRVRTYTRIAETMPAARVPFLSRLPPFARDGPRGNKALWRVVVDGERRGTARTTTWQATGGQAGAGWRIKTNEHGRVLCSLHRRQIGIAVNHRDKTRREF